jgi:thioredoxin-like negative regulator of GroEL
MSTSYLPRLSQDSYQSFIDEGVAVVLFWAEWDVNSKMMESLLGLMSATFKNAAGFAVMDVDDKSMWDIMANLKILRTPTIAIYKSGTLERVIAGFVEAAQIREIVNDVIHSE